jgi:copper chaperone NosL
MRGWLLSACLVFASCAAGAAPPETIALGQEACAQCRMVIVSRMTAAQIVAPGEEPRFFDEIGCLRDYLASGRLTGDARIYVADHRTGDWIDAERAVFTHTAVSTPMTTGLLAHANEGSRNADAAAHGGEPIAASAILGLAAGDRNP